MDIILPHTIDTGQGEKIIFKENKTQQLADGDKLIIEGFCKPNLVLPCTFILSRTKVFR